MTFAEQLSIAIKHWGSSFIPTIVIEKPNIKLKLVFIDWFKDTIV
jgi:hypothetical protein